MKQKNSRSTRDGVKFMGKEYRFMLARGYEVISVEDAFLGWQVMLGKQDLFVQVLHTRGEDYVSFRTGKQPPDEWIDMQSVVYAATGEKVPMNGVDSKELPKYIDTIESYFEGEYRKNPDGLRAAAQAYQASLPKVEPVSLEELEIKSKKQQKIIPVLYYPLMAIILLLLFGILTTLYMVLLGSLFSAFSLDLDSYGMVMGIGAILLAIGTMLLFRKWVKFVG